MDHHLDMNSAQKAADDVYGASILHYETLAAQVHIQARRLRAEGKAGWAADYDVLAAEHAADAGRSLAKSSELEIKLSPAA